MITHSNQKNKTVSEGPIEKITTDQLLGDQKTLEFLKFATDKGYTNIESAFKDWSFPKMQEIIANQEGLAKNVNRNKGKVVNKSNAGSKGVVKDSKLKAWNSANMSNPDVKKYFE